MSCASLRPASEKQKLAMAKGMNRYYETPEGIAHSQKMSKVATAKNTGSEMPVLQEDFAVAIPDIRDLRDYSDYIEGYAEASDW